MSKSVRYKLNKSKGKRNKRKKVGKSKKVVKVPFKKFLKLLFLLAIVCILGFWFFVAYRTVTEIKVKDVVESDSEIVKFAEDGKVRKTLLIYEDPNSVEEKNLFILAIIFNSDTSEVLIYYYPRNIYIHDYFAEKYISIENLTYAGNSYMYEEKYAYVIRQIEEQMSVKFDSYIWFGSEAGRNFVSDNERWGYSEEDVFELFSKLSFFNLITKYYKVYLFEEFLHSNMNFVEMYTYFQSIKGIVNAGNYKFVNLGEKSMTQDVILGSGKNVRSLNMNAVDNSLRENIDILRARDLSREHVKVEVYNGTDIPGYARIMARKIFNAGCRVIRYENSSQNYEQNYIYIPDKEKFPNGLEVVNSIVEDATIVVGRPDFLTTGDIVVVLGQKE